MGKTLRICLAMGGGVSLGAFSGSSLTEALKLLVLFGKDNEGKPYDKVVVDGMSGASAGAIALTIMLKCLIDYKAMMPLFDAELTEDHLIREISDDYFNGDLGKARAHREIESLKALQLAQKIQHKLWVEEVDALKLYGKKIEKNYQSDINDAFALLDRGLLENLTKKYLMKSDGFNVENRQLLDRNRVLFACSLTNLLPIEISSAFDDLTKLEANVKKSVGSQNHSELRVIDFVFDEASISDKPTDTMWLKFSNNPSNSDVEYDIASKEAWATISASALACGAFPIAFEPVILKRYQSEFGGNARYSQWPKSFVDVIGQIENSRKKHGVNFRNVSYFAESIRNELNYKSFNFPYMDGGTFNNEPIREAFRIGTFQDFGNENKNTERLVLFVDPIVRQDQNHSFRLPAFSPVKKSGDVSILNNEISKLLGGVASIIEVLTNQGSVKEEHKIIDVKENFDLRRTIFKYLEGNNNLGQTLNVDILSTAFNKIYKNLRSEIISSGTRDPIVYFLNEIRKNCLNYDLTDSKCLIINNSQLQLVRKQIDEGQIGSDDIHQVFEILGLDNSNDRNVFAQSVFKLIIDFSLNTDGKNEEATRAAILPINTELETISLPGEEIEAFGGFASLRSRRYAFEYARLSTLMSLSEAEQGFRNEPQKAVGVEMLHRKTGKTAIVVDPSLDKLQVIIESRIEKIEFYSKQNTYSSDLKNNLFSPSIDRIKGILLKNKYLKFILLNVPFVATSLFGAIALPVISVGLLWKSLFKKSPWKGSNILKRLIRNGASQVNYLSLEPITFSVLSDNEISNKLLVKCSDSGIKKLKALKTDFLDFNGKKRYRYYFQFHLLEYIDLNKKIPYQSMSSNFTSLKIDASLIERMGISISSKVELPKNIDGNLNSQEMRLAIQDNYKNIVKEIRIDKYNLPFINTALNEDISTLHHSVKNINYHVNPVIEIDLQNFENGWYFKEYTESLDKKLMR